MTADTVMHFIARLLPILSNLPFLAASSRVLEYGYASSGTLDPSYAFEAMLWALVALFTSPSYHLCMGFGACLWSVSKHVVVDFWSAEMAMPMVALRFVRFRDPAPRIWIIFLSMIIIGLLVTGTESNFMGQAVIGALAGLFVVAYLLWYRTVHGYWPEYDMLQLTLGLGFLVLGICFFVVQEWWPPYYWYNHSYWHSSIAVGVFFMVGIAPPTQPPASSSSSSASVPAGKRLVQVDARFLVLLRAINDAIPAPRPAWLTRFRVPRASHAV